MLKQIKNKEKFYLQIRRLYQAHKSWLKSFVLIFIIGFQIALFLSYLYFIYSDKIWANEGIRDTLTYQGKIVNADGVPPPDGQYNMRFRIYDQASSGSLLWTEVWDSTGQGIAGSKVEVSAGVFTVELNSLCGNWVGACSSNGGISFATDSFYLQVELDYDNNGTFEEIFMPRKRFTATPYSMNADKIDGYDSADFLLNAGDTMTGALNVPKIIDSSLIADYQFNGTANDSSSNLQNGVLQNSATVTNDILNLDGVNQYVSVDDNDLLSLGSGTADNSLTISAWIKMNEATNFIILSKGAYNSDGEYKLFIDGADKLNLLLYDESVADCYIGRLYNTALTNYEGEWVWIAATYSGLGSSAGVKLYINGIQADDINSENNQGSYVAMENLASPLYLGRSDTNYAKGQMDNVKINKRELSANEIRDLYASDLHQNIYGNKITAHTIYLEYVDNGETESGYLTWDKLYNRIKFSSEAYIPKSQPYLANQANPQDYTHFADVNKILAYDFADSAGNAVTDWAGNSNGTLNGNSDWTNLGYSGYGLNFDNDGDSVSFADPGLSSDQGTIEMWARLNNVIASQDNYLIRLSESTSNEIVIAKQNEADLIFKIGNSGILDTGIDLADTSWHHVALTWQSGNYVIYGDTNLMDSGTFSGLDVSKFDKFYLGSAGSANTSLNGSLDSVAIYNDALSPAEITAHFNSAFNDLYVANNLSDGSNFASLGSLIGSPASLNENNLQDPVYFGNSSKVVGLAMAEGQGTETVNVTGDDQPIISGTKWVKGYYGYGLDFNGSSDYLSIADSDNLDMGTDNFTIEFYFKGNADNSQTDKRIISKRSGDTGYEIFFNSTDRLNFFIGDGVNTATSDLTGSVDMSDGKWHHLMIIFDRADSGSIYFDSSLVKTANISSVTGSLDNAADLYIAKDASANFYQGSLDSILIYKSLLSLVDVLQRKTNGPESLIINSYNATLPIVVGLNSDDSNDAMLLGLINADNTTGYPLKIWNSGSHISGSDTIFNLIHFGDISNANYGNLTWDNTNQQFIFDQSLKITGDLTSNYLSTGANEFLAFDIIRHTVVSDDVTAKNFTEAWSTTTTKKVNTISAVCVHESDENDKLTADDWEQGGCDNAIKYDGTNITIYDQNDVWLADDIITIFISYEK